MVNGKSLDTQGNMKEVPKATIKVNVNKKLSLLTIVKDSLDGTQLCKSLYNQWLILESSLVDASCDALRYVY